ncbi:MAG: hypothetical protein WBA61_01280 [Aequorivita sp.]
MRKVKIISIGLSQSNFLIQLYSQIKLRTDKFSFHVDNFKDLSQGAIEYNNQVFESYHNFNKHQFSKWVQFQALISILFKKIFWIFLWFEVKQGNGTKYIIKFIKKEVKIKACVDKIVLPLNFDVYQFHYCVRSSLKIIHYLPRQSKIVCSFWGSDLYRNKGAYNNFYVKKALGKATHVTIQTPEMGSDLFRIYGDFLSDKTIYAQFAIETEIYSLIDRYRNDGKSLSEFKKKYNIPNDNFIFTIGYNANKAFGHIDILKELNQLNWSIKKRITCILPLTYSRGDIDYLQRLYDLIKLLDFNVVCFDSFMSHEDIAKFRLITDIQIQMPVSDALSGSVTEILYAGNVVLAGDWLPYGIYKRNDISIETIESVEKLNLQILRIIENIDKFKSFGDDRRIKIKNVFFPESTSKAWIGLYNKLSEQKLENRV